MEQELLHLVRKLRYLYFLLKQSPVSIGKSLQVVLQVSAATLGWCIENLKEPHEGIAEFGGVIADEVVVELVVAEDAGIFSIETEHQAHTQDVEPAQGLGRIVVVLPKQGIVD